MLRNSVERSKTIVAHSVMSTQMERVHRESKNVRDRFGEKITLIAGGPHASARPSDLLHAGFDYVVVGEGEKALPDLLWHLMNSKDPMQVKGVVSKATQDYPHPKDLPKVDFDKYPPFALEKNILGPVEVTRGCPFRCKFCSTPFLTGGTVRHRSIESVRFWLQKAVERRGFKRTWFLSPNALSYGGRGRKTELEKLESLLQHATSIEGLEEVFFGSFPSEVRPEFVTKEALEMMASYVANDSLQIGLQSASDRVLEHVNRHHTVEEGMKAIAVAFDCGLVPHVDMIFGLPGETKMELDASINLCEDLAKMGAKVHGHVFMPLPGSEFERMPPGRLDDDSRSALGELARKGFLTGSWSAQEHLAQKLASKSDS
jgi:B12-binding domain/radical SAM domain protein